MNAMTMVAATTLLMSSSLALAAGETQDHEAHHPEPADATAQQMPAGSAGGMPMMQMHEQMQKMHAQMEEIRRTEDPDKRDELIQSHMADMQGMMKMMQDMHGDKPMMGPGGMMGQGMRMQGGGMTGGQQGDKRAASQGGMTGEQQPGMMEMMNRQQMMEQRMDMLQMLMDQMLQNQAAMEETRTIRDRRHDHSKTK
ncbi:MAG: hypothetical protein WCH04_09030 [Gammaproteobacteria bacterium]